MGAGASRETAGDLKVPCGIFMECIQFRVVWNTAGAALYINFSGYLDTEFKAFFDMMSVWLFPHIKWLFCM